MNSLLFAGLVVFVVLIVATLVNAELTRYHERKIAAIESGIEDTDE